MLSLKNEKSQKIGGNGRFGCLAAAYCLASYSYELYSNDNFFFLIGPQNQPVQCLFYTTVFFLLQCHY